MTVTHRIFTQTWFEWWGWVEFHFCAAY